MARLRYNGLSGTLGASLTNSATSVTFASKLTHVGGDVPTISGSDYIPLSILDANGKCAEVVHLTAYTSAATSGTIARGKEGSSGVAHDNGRTFVNGILTRETEPLSAEEWLLQRPLSAHADNVEFADYQASGTDPVAGLGFSWGNQGSASCGISRGRLYINADGSTSSQVRGLYKSAGWTADRTVSSIHAGSGTANFVGAVLVLLWGTLSSPTSIAMVRTGQNVNASQFATFATFGLGSGLERGAKTLGAAAVGAYRLGYTHSSKAIAGSVWNGAGWTPLGSYTASAAPDYWGIGYVAESATAHNTLLPAVQFAAVRHNWDAYAD